MPTEIGTFEYDPSKDLCGFYIEANIMDGGVGPRTRLIQFFKQKNIPLVTITGRFKGGIACDLAIVELANDPEKRKNLVEEIKKEFGQKLIHIEIVESGVPGLVYDTNAWPLSISCGKVATKAIALTEAGWSCFFNALYLKWGKGSLKVYKLVGREVGEAQARAINAEMPSLNLEDKIRMLLNTAQLLGWGRFELFEVNKENHFGIKAFENFECEATKKTAGYENSFISGVFEGMMNEFLGIPHKCEEIWCIKRESPYCIFKISQEEVARGKNEAKQAKRIHVSSKDYSLT